MSPERDPSETSPLLGAQSNGNASYSATTAEPVAHPDPALSEQGDSDGEDAAKSDSQSVQGLSYIIPAISLGVGGSPISNVRSAFC